MRINGNELKYLREVLDSEFRTSTNGFMVRRAEEAFCKEYHQQHAVAFCNGTATLHACLVAAGVKKGDYVAVPPLTMASTALAVLHAGAIPVWVDVDLSSWTMSPTALSKTCRTYPVKAVIVVSLYGAKPDMDGLKRSAGDAVIIEDAAQDILTECKADMTSFSFQASKHLTCGEGGLVTTNSADHATRLRQFGSLGYALNPEKPRICKQDIQDPKYMRHDILGWNYRMSDLQAAVLLAQLERKTELADIRHLSMLAYDVGQRSGFLEWQDSNSFWAAAAVIKDASLWHDFRDKFVKNGGKAPYAAWALNYNEKVFSKYICDACPVAEDLQPRIMAFPTNLWGMEERFKQRKALEMTLEEFE